MLELRNYARWISSRKNESKRLSIVIRTGDIDLLVNTCD